jgi:Right handed beta helix region
VKNGRVQNFDLGIKSAGAISVCQVGTDDTSLTVTINRVGIDLDADNCTIIKTAVTANLSDGAVVRGDANQFVRNTCSRNGGTGLAVQGSDNFLNQNRCKLNGGDGILVTGDTNTLVRNLGGRNGGTGVLADGSGNTFQHNQGRTNDGDGIRGIGTMLESDGRNYGVGNGGVNCGIDGFPTLAGGYC